MDESDRAAGSPPDAGPEAGQGGRPRSVNLAAVAGAVVLIGLVAFALYRRSQSAVPAEAPAAGDQAPEAAPAEGTAITAVVPIRLTPEASVAAERYRCVCGCNDPLSVCTCTETPGSRDMKTYLQSLVDEKRPMGEIDAAMVAKYGGLVLLSTPSPRPGRTPARP